MDATPILVHARSRAPVPSWLERLRRLFGGEVILSRGLLGEIEGTTDAIFDYTLTPERLGWNDPVRGEVCRIDLTSVEEFSLRSGGADSPLTELWMHTPTHDVAVALISHDAVAAHGDPAPVGALLTYVLLKHGARSVR